MKGQKVFLSEVQSQNGKSKEHRKSIIMLVYVLSSAAFTLT